MSISNKLIHLLADGRFHSGTEMAKVIGVSRAAVWKNISQLKEIGLEVYSITGRGYKIPGGIDLLDREWLQGQLATYFASEIKLEIFNSIASTNQYLIDSEVSTKYHFCLSEYQYAGRGRLGRQWHSPFARNIYLSVKAQLPSQLELSGLSLAVGVWIAKVIEKYGATGIQVKWPNDLLIDNKKVGGILTELSNAGSNRREIVIGIGINWAMPNDSVVDQSWTNLQPILKTLTRNQMAFYLIEALVTGLKEFERSTTASFKNDWPRFDYLAGKQISIKLGNRHIVGNYAGIDQSGLILLEKDGELASYSGGEVSVRAV